MDSEFIKKLMWKWAVEEGFKIIHCPPEAKFLTGSYKLDGQMHYFQFVSGLELELTKDLKDIVTCKIVDEEKFMLFVLRWA